MSVEREMSLAEWCAKLPSQHVVNRELATLTKQLAALAEQNERMRVALQAMVDEAFARNCGLKIADDALSLPDLASPVLNRIRAEGVRKASTLVSLVRNDWASAGDNLSVQAAEYLISALDTRAAELEKTND